MDKEGVPRAPQAAGRPLRFLFFSKTSLLRHFDSTLVRLAGEGHELVLVTPDPEPYAKVPSGLHDLPNVHAVSFNERRRDGLQPTIRVVRRARDLLRYLDPQLEVAYANRDRAWQTLIAAISRDSRSEAELAHMPELRLHQEEVRRLEAVLATIEGLIPSDKAVEDFIASHQPDAVLVTPLVTPGSRQADMVKACQALQIPCGFPVFSWDNLSNKGTIHVLPDRVYVWNEVQAAEAVDLHGVPRERVVVTGAPRFDAFFDLEPSGSRERMVSKLGLDPSNPVILYVGSSPFVAPAEPEFVDSWIHAVRSSRDRRLREAGIIIRPHPRHRDAWEGWESDRWAGVVFKQTSMYNAQSLYDAITCCDVVVGLNTSAEIEAAILGKPVYTVDAGRAAPGQDGSKHYYYLLEETGGFAKRASSLSEHLLQISAGVRGDHDAHRIEQFAESFIRPLGLNVPVTPILAAAFVDLAARGGGAGSVVTTRPTAAGGHDGRMDRSSP